MFASKADDPSSVPEIYMAEGEDRLHQVILSPPQECCGTRVHPTQRVYAHTIINKCLKMCEEASHVSMAGEECSRRKRLPNT